jgi:octanoyl-[GcvH]:protein N-octanoyltransferase
VSLPTLRICLDDVAGGPTSDTAVSRAVLQRVDAGELPATLRLSRPPRVVAFSSRDARNPAFPDAVAAARERGFASVLRLAGGRAAVFTPETIAFAWAVPASSPSEGIRDRFATLAGALRDAFRSLGADARVGEVPGEYCPGEWSVNIGGTRKVAGVGQRLLRRAAHTGGVIVVRDGPLINDVLTPVYAAMGEPWEPRATGQLRDVVDASWRTVRDAVVDAFAATHDLEPWALDAATLELGRRLAPEHHPTVGTPAGPR